MDRAATTTNANARTTGARWEDAALAYLQARGLALVARNFNSRFGEIDLVLRDRTALVFAEVRFRGARARGDGTLSVGSAKRQKLIRAASLYLQAHPQFATLPCRFDVIGCSGTLAAPHFDWTQAAFEAF
jgi:putative endonuclease